MSSLEGVVILGGHRSGTSLITRLVSLLGLSVCRREDLLVGREANPLGHWESKSMVDFNDQLLRELDSTWHCPPVLESAETLRLRDRRVSGALAALRNAHPERPFVWKDPRTCVLLPFWSGVLEQRVAYVVVVRHPLEVAESLARRNGFTSLLSLALWERYTRQAMLGAAGRPVMVCTYDEVLVQPAAWCWRLVAFLDELGLQTRGVDEVAVAAVATSNLRHSRRSWTDLEPGSAISPEQVALARVAKVSVAQTSYVPPALPAETSETESIFGQIRRHIADARPGTPGLPALPRSLVRPSARAAQSNQNLPPPVSVILAQDGASIEASISILGETLPARSEILIAGADGAHGNERTHRSKISLRHIPCDRSPGGSEALALGVQAASGRMALLSTGGLLRCSSWYEDVSKALRGPRVGGVGPVMRLSSCPNQRHFGRAFIDEDLASRFVTGVAAERLVPAALLLESLCAFKRELLVAAGGVDKDFSSASSAVAELSLRMWRMGFRCFIVPSVEVWTEPAAVDIASEDERLYDRLRIATLHFSPARLQAFTDRASRQPSYDEAAARLRATDVHLRRAAIEAVCAFSSDRYFDDFPLRLTSLRSRLRRAERFVADRGRRSHFVRTVNRMSKRARGALSQRVSRS
ncbi:MAG TPA: hypothetical protein VK538_02275 [Solirubrobacteraceae bacterium]|nr:hypothetical protein [Solirubrobacteraceae bacterium]